MRYKTVKLGEICDIERGGSPRPIQNYITDAPDGINWIKIGDATASSKYIYKTKEKIKPAGVKKSRMVYEGDFILSNSMSFGHPYIMKTTGCIHDGWLVLRKPKVDSDYLFHILSSDFVFKQFEQLAAGTTVKNINISIAKSVELPLPPLLEQKRIAEVLDKADALREKRRLALQKLDTLLKSVFIEMFGDPVKNPKGLTKKTLGELIKVKSGDFLPEKSFNKAGSIPVYGGNGISGYHNEFMFDQPMLMIGRVGVYCGVVHLTRAFSWITDNALYISEKSDELNETYLYYALKQANLNQYAGRFAQPLISGSRIYPISILVPPMDLQNKFALVIRKIKDLESKQTKALGKGESLFQSLQQKAFKGELFSDESLAAKPQEEIWQLTSPS